jgi:nitroreductase
MSMSTAVQDPRGAIDLIYRRRAVRAYQPNAIEERRLHALLEAAVHADARGLR